MDENELSNGFQPSGMDSKTSPAPELPATEHSGADAIGGVSDGVSDELRAAEGSSAQSKKIKSKSKSKSRSKRGSKSRSKSRSKSKSMKSGSKKSKSKSKSQSKIGKSSSAVMSGSKMNGLGGESDPVAKSGSKSSKLKSSSKIGKGKSADFQGGAVPFDAEEKPKSKSKSRSRESDSVKMTDGAREEILDSGNDETYVVGNGIKINGMKPDNGLGIFRIRQGENFNDSDRVYLDFESVTETTMKNWLGSSYPIEYLKAFFNMGGYTFRNVDMGALAGKLRQGMEGGHDMKKKLLFLESKNKNRHCFLFFLENERDDDGYTVPVYFIDKAFRKKVARNPEGVAEMRLPRLPEKKDVGFHLMPSPVFSGGCRLEFQLPGAIREKMNWTKEKLMFHILRVIAENAETTVNDTRKGRDKHVQFFEGSFGKGWLQKKKPGSRSKRRSRRSKTQRSTSAVGSSRRSGSRSRRSGSRSRGSKSRSGKSSSRQGSSSAAASNEGSASRSRASGSSKSRSNGSRSGSKSRSRASGSASRSRRSGSASGSGSGSGSDSGSGSGSRSASASGSGSGSGEESGSGSGSGSKEE